MQTRDQADNIVGSQVDRDSKYKNERQKNGLKTSKSQNQKADVQKNKGSGRNRSRTGKVENHSVFTWVVGVGGDGCSQRVGFRQREGRG